MPADRRASPRSSRLRRRDHARRRGRLSPLLTEAPGPAGLRPERRRLRSEHADQPDPGHGRRDRRPSRCRTSSGHSATRCCSSPAPTARPRDPLNFQVGYYTERRGPRPVAGRRGHQRVGLRAQPVRRAGSCVALNNFWRSLSNLTINVTNPDFGCYTGEFWAVSQAAPMRRVHVNGQHDADGLLHRPVVRQRRVHRRLAVRRRHVDQRLAAAVAGPQQHPRRLEQRRLEPGVLRCRRRARPVLPGRSRHAAARTRRSRRAR